MSVGKMVTTTQHVQIRSEIFLIYSFIFANPFTMATDHPIPASKQQQPGTSAFKVRRNPSETKGVIN